TGLNPGEETWLRMVGQQLRANADAYSGEAAEFQVEQFAFHPFSQLGGLQQAVRVFGSEARLRARNASLNAQLFGGAAGDSATPQPHKPAPPPATH
ncbi:MAG: hypothetical protein ACR2JA_10725, partial [Hydrogenophaga sp.]|uniref:hypothetical protein n=1 Tax=Hydrogenophaga sp. TaxID=1904254 RepID=UPI003D9AEDE6